MVLHEVEKWGYAGEPCLNQLGLCRDFDWSQAATLANLTFLGS